MWVPPSPVERNGLELWEDRDLGTGFLHHRIRLPRPQDAPPRGPVGAPQPPYNTPDKEIKTPTPPQKNTHKQKKRKDDFFFRYCFRRFGKNS